MRELDEAGTEVCLPVCVKLGEPLSFRRWTKGAKMERGFWDIPIPADPTEVEPKTLVAPIVGYDGAGYRLGYGGGFFDRTLAKLGSAAAAIGVGFSMFRLETIHPQPHDIAMAAIVTEAGVLDRDPARPASNVCYLNEADATYSGFDSPAESAAKLAGIADQIPPERRGLIDYALWRLGQEAVTPAPGFALDAVLPRIRNDAVHTAIAALRDSK
jgi:hypothetical protein